MPLWVAFLPPSGKYTANGVDGWVSSGNLDDMYNLLQPVKVGSYRDFFPYLWY
jgi:hypothetical protein